MLQFIIIYLLVILYIIEYNVKYNDSFELVPKVDVYKEDYFIKEKSVFPFIYKKSKHIKTKYIITENNCGC